MSGWHSQECSGGDSDERKTDLNYLIDEWEGRTMKGPDHHTSDNVVTQSRRMVTIDLFTSICPHESL